MILEMERDANQPQWRQIATYGRWTLGDVVVELQHDGYRLVSTTEAAAASPGGQDRRRTLEAMGEEEWCAKDLGAKLGISKDTAQRRLLQLLAAGKVRVSGTGKRGMKLYLCVTPHQDLGQGTAATAPVIRGGAVAAVGPLSAERPHAEVCGGAADGDAERKPSF